MNSNKQPTASAIRFRRWSRVGYAVFCSLACSVSIGVLAVSVSDKSLQKADSVSMSSFYTKVSDAESPDWSEETVELELALLQKQEKSLLEITIDSSAACAQITYNYFINCNG